MKNTEAITPELLTKIAAAANEPGALLQARHIEQTNKKGRWVLYWNSGFGSCGTLTETTDFPTFSRIVTVATAKFREARAAAQAHRLPPPANLAAVHRPGVQPLV